MTQEMFPSGDLQHGQSLASDKKAEQEFVDQVMYWLTAPYVTWPGYEDIYQANDNKTMALVRRLAHHEEIAREKMCTGFEAMLYMSTATLVHPPTHAWYRIYMYLFQTELPEQAKVQNFTEVKELDSNEMEELNGLRRWIYKTQVLHIKNKREPEAKETRELAKEVEFEQPRLI